MGNVCPTIFGHPFSLFVILFWIVAKDFIIATCMWFGIFDRISPIELVSRCYCQHCGWCYTHIYNAMADVIAILPIVIVFFGFNKADVIALPVQKADVVALWLVEFATYLINIGWWYCLCYVYTCGLMLLPQWQMELPHVNQGWWMVMNVMCGRWNSHCQHFMLIVVLWC